MYVQQWELRVFSRRSKATRRASTRLDATQDNITQPTNILWHEGMNERTNEPITEPTNLPTNQPMTHVSESGEKAMFLRRCLSISGTNATVVLLCCVVALFVVVAVVVVIRYPLPLSLLSRAVPRPPFVKNAEPAYTSSARR